MLPVLTGVRIEIDGSTISLLATDRFRLAHRELAWNPRTPDISAAALVRPGSSATPPRRSPPAVRSPSRSSTTGTGEGIIGFEGEHPAVAGVRRRGCSTVSSPRCAACSPPST